MAGLTSRKLLLTGFLIVTLSSSSLGQQTENDPERLEWFSRLGLGLFIHWSVDSQLGSVISHSMVGASEEYLDRYLDRLPETFNPTRFDPDEWARLASVAGFRYVVFTAKHHSGFCMFHTETHDFDIASTPYKTDITRQLIEAFRKQGLAIGLYYSPDDFFVLHQQGHLISRRRPEAQPVNNPGLMANDKAQLAELLQNYGKIDILFIDGPPEGLREFAWEQDPKLVITRGALETPEITPSTEQRLPGSGVFHVWEACFTMGTSWQYKPTNEIYRSGTEWIELLVETRTKGGNMLLNIGPKPNGEIPVEQEDILRELGLWLFVNGEAVYDVEPWQISNEGDVWFTASRDEDVLYAIVTGEVWEYGRPRTIRLKSLALGPDAEIEVLGQNGKVLEYQPEVVPETRWREEDGALVITATRAQRLYNDRTWPNPVVLKITGATYRAP